MANIKPGEPTEARDLTELYPRDGHTEVDPRATGGKPLNPENPGFASQDYQGQGMAAPRYEEQREMENGEEEE